MLDTSDPETVYIDDDPRAVPLQQAQVMPLEPMDRITVDTQVATAHRFPRDIRRAIDRAIDMATYDMATAETCRYALPRSGKIITGPTVHLAKIVASTYGNLRTESRVVEITPRQVVARGSAWDLENNNAAAWEVRRSIIDRRGRTFGDDLITVTGNAACAIAFRNAIFSVIPRNVTDKVYNAALTKITGDLSDPDKLRARRISCLNYFREQYSISQDEVLALLGLKSAERIRAEEIATLIGFYNALRDGDITPQSLLKGVRSVEDSRLNMRKHRADTARNSNPAADMP